MLLRRVIGHVKAQNWAAVAIDFVIVVVGVFIGIQVSNWNEVRKDSSREAEYLQSLGRDLDTSLEHADAIVESLAKIRSAQIALADHIQGIRRLDLNDLNEAIHQGLYPLPELDVSMPTYHELKTSGATPVLKDRTLRFALQELDSRLEQVRQTETDKTEIFYRFSDPFLIESFNLNTPGAFANEADADRPFIFVRKDPATDPNAALKTDRFKNILIYRFNADGNQLQAILDLREQYVKIDGIVRTRLENLE